MTLTQITEKGIKDGEIINADINANAAIAGSKISPDFGSQNITTTGRANIAHDLTITGTAPRVILTDTDNNDDFRINVDSGNFQIEDATNGNADRLVIDSSGNVGIGTASPGDKLEVVDASVLLKLNSSNEGNYDVRFVYQNSEANIWSYSSSDLTFGTRFARKLHLVTNGPQKRVTIDDGGRVGIGTTSPDAPLTIHNSGTPEIRFGYNSSQDHKLAWDSSKVRLSADPENANSGSAIQLDVDGTVRLYINDSGNVGIGTTNPSANLHLKVTGTDSPYQQFESASYSSYVGTAHSDNNLGTGSKAGNLVLRGQTGVAIMGNNGTTTQVKIDSDGLKFGSSTAAANALDVYEEGTCTPSFVPASGSFGVIYQSGHYTRIGDVVHLTASISINGATNASGEVQITGLPFSVRGINSTWSGEAGHGVGRWFYAGPNHYCFLVCDNSTDRIRIHKADGTFLNTSNMSTGYNQSQFSFTVTYLTDS